MPIFDYACLSCGKTYDVYHKVREVIEDVICPACGSTEHKKLISVPAAFRGESSSDASSATSSCEAGGCCGGACSLN